jgi:hypothetical protein
MIPEQARNVCIGLGMLQMRCHSYVVCSTNQCRRDEAKAQSNCGGMLKRNHIIQAERHDCGSDSGRESQDLIAVRWQSQPKVASDGLKTKCEDSLKTVHKTEDRRT